MVTQDLMVKLDATLATLNLVQSVFSDDARGFLVSPAREDLAYSESSLCIPSGTMFFRFTLRRKRS